MFRHIIAATAVSLLATGAMAQNTIDRAGTGADSTIDANSPNVDRVVPGQASQSNTADDPRWAEYDRRMTQYEERIAEMERWRDENAGVDRAGTGGDSTQEANSPNVDRVQPAAN